MSELLSDDDLYELTGTRQKARQVQRLQGMGLRPLVPADGRPRVTWGAVTLAMAGQTGTGGSRPNFQALRKAG